MKKNYVFILFLITINFSFAQTSVPIVDIKTNDSNGALTQAGQTVTVSGIVTSSNQFGNSGPGSIQDETAGISVFGSLFSNQVNIGDSVTVTALLDQFNGLSELNFSESSILINHSSNNNIEPEIITIEQILNQDWNGIEEYEGELVRINNVTITGSGNFSGNQNYSISDETGISELRIDDNVSTIIGTPIPSGHVDIIGILGQFDFGPPYNSGYQILPRFIQDLDYGNSPIIINPVFAADIDTSSFTVFFKTVRNGNSQVKFGLTQSLEIDSVIINDDTTYHVVKIENLNPSTKYYYKVYSENSSGRSESSIKTVTTSSNNPSLGKINVYFNFSVDTSIAIPGNNAKGNVDFEEKLIERINNADYSIDLALYSFFGMQNAADALIVAKNRGLKIRVVYDSRSTQNSMQALINAGIQISKRPSTLDGIMHNKIFIFDGRDSIETNDWVWTGSWNVTSTELNWKNNVIEINDPGITSTYETEFNEMWGSDGDSPNSANAKFGSEKTDNTSHFFNVGGREVQIYFSPSDGTTSKIINTINTADQNIYLGLYVITRDDIENAIHEKYNSGLTDIRGVVDDINSNGTEFYNLGAYTEMLENPSPTLHSKYAIIDANTGSSPYVITGSHNWSSAAENDNDENTLIIQDSLIANQFLQDFKKRYNEAGGTGAFIVPTDIDENEYAKKLSYKLFQNYPNPFNPVTTIKFEIPYSQKVVLKIFNILGEEVKTLYNGFAPEGILAVDFNAKDPSNGTALPSGIYIYQIKADNFISSKKLMLLK